MKIIKNFFVDKLHKFDAKVVIAWERRSAGDLLFLLFLGLLLVFLLVGVFAAIDFAGDGIKKYLQSN